MTFTPRTFEDITSRMVAWLLASPEAASAAPDMDLNVGSVERSHLEAVAVQVEEHEVRTAQAVEEATRESCFRAFGFDLLPARPAFGSVVFTAMVAPVAQIQIPAGTRLIGSRGHLFATTANAHMSVGSTTTAAVPVLAVEAGTGGNLAANSITRLAAPIPGIDLVTNPVPTLGGAEAESSEARAERFAAWVRTLPRGTAEAIEYAARSVSAVQDARVVEPGLIDPRPTGVPFAGLVWVFCDDGAGLTPSTKAQVEKVLNGYVNASGAQVPGWKAAGVRVEVLASRVANVCIRGSVKLIPGGEARWDSIKASLTDTAQSFFEGVRIGDPVSYQALSAELNKCDDDVAEVNLFLWAAGSTPPEYSATPLAADFSAVNVDADPLSLGARCVMDQTGIYPEWVLG